MKSSDIDQDLFTDSYCKVCSAQLISESQRVAHYEVRTAFPTLFANAEDSSPGHCCRTPGSSLWTWGRFEEPQDLNLYSLRSRPGQVYMCGVGSEGWGCHCQTLAASQILFLNLYLSPWRLCLGFLYLLNLFLCIYEVRFRDPGWNALCQLLSPPMTAKISSEDIC